MQYEQFSPSEGSPAPDLQPLALHAEKDKERSLFRRVGRWLVKSQTTPHHRSRVIKTHYDIVVSPEASLRRDIREREHIREQLERQSGTIPPRPVSPERIAIDVIHIQNLPRR